MLLELFAAACPLAGDDVPISLKLQLVPIEGPVLISMKEEILARGLSNLLHLFGEAQLDGVARALDLNRVRCVFAASDDLAGSGDQFTDKRFMETEDPVNMCQGRGDAQAATAGDVPARGHLVARHAAEEGPAQSSGFFRLDRQLRLITLDGLEEACGLRHQWVAVVERARDIDGLQDDGVPGPGERLLDPLDPRGIG